MVTSRGPLGGAGLGRLGKLVSRDNAAIGLIIDTRYEVQSRIGKGGMGEVFLARDLRLQRSVAMKILSRPASDGRWEERFEAEARIMSRIEHPGLVPVFDMGRLPDGRLYYTMKYVPGVTLDKMFGEGLPLNHMVGILEQVCETVEHAHERHIVHRDLKPANIIIGERGRVYVLDWGIARVREEMRRAYPESFGSTPGQTATGTVLGTVEYMPPEQARGELEAVDSRSDVYALGAILYEIMTGRPPVVGDGVTAMLDQVVEGAIVNPRQRNPEIPAGLEAVCMKALSHDPLHRYATAGAMGRDLARWRAGQSPEARETRWWQRVLQYHRSHPRRWIIAAGSLLLMATLAVGGMTLLAWHKDAQRRQVQLEVLADLEPARTRLDQAARHLRRSDVRYSDYSPDVQEALRVIESVRDRASWIPAVHHLEGRAWSLLGRSDRAEECWKRATGINSGFDPACYELARLHLLKSYVSGLAGAEAEREKRRPLREHHLNESERWLKRVEIQSDDPLSQLMQETVCVMRLYVHDRGAEALTRARAGIGRYKGQEGVEDLYWIAALSASGSERRELLEAALATDPNHVGALFLRSMERIDAEDYAGTITDCSRILEVSPRFFDALILRSGAYLRQGENEAAVKDLDRALELNPDDAVAHNNRSVARFESGDLEGALQDIAMALRLEPDDPMALFNRGKVRFAQNEFAVAVEDFSQALKMGPPDALTLRYRAHSHLELDDLESAVRDATEAIRLDATDAPAYLVRATVHRMRGSYEASLEDCSQAVRLAPEDAQGHRERGNTLVCLGRIDEALKDLDEAVRLDPQDAPAHYHRGTCLQQQGRNEEAEQEFTRVLELDPEHLGALTHRATVLRMLERPAEALEDLDRAVALHPANADVLQSRAILRVALEEYSAAEKDATLAIEIRPDFARAYYIRAIARRESGNTAAAISDYHKVLELVAVDDPIRSNVEDVLSRLLKELPRE